MREPDAYRIRSVRQIQQRRDAAHARFEAAKRDAVQCEEQLREAFDGLGTQEQLSYLSECDASQLDYLVLRHPKAPSENQP